MEFRPIPCHESLRPFIRNYWIINAQGTARGTQTVFSNGAGSLHFYLSQAVAVNDSKTLHRTMLYHQEMNSVGVVTEEGPVVIFGVEFVPFCSRMFFKTAFVGEFQTPEELHDEEFTQMCSNVHEAADLDARVALLDKFFLKRLTEIPANDVNMDRLKDVFDEIVPTDGTVACPPGSKEEFSTSDLASTACLSQKQFTRVFNKYVGMNPKTYLRLLRFHKALMELQQSPQESLTDVAWRCGYYDLPHMTTDFKDICGFSPSQLISTGAGLTETFGPNFSGLMKKKIKIENLI